MPDEYHALVNLLRKVSETDAAL
eukprot:SAG22_NODE_21893_length_253_cov_0.668831_1_plen_23_part_10